MAKEKEMPMSMPRQINPKKRQKLNQHQRRSIKTDLKEFMKQDLPDEDFGDYEDRK